MKKSNPKNNYKSQSSNVKRATKSRTKKIKICNAEACEHYELRSDGVWLIRAKKKQDAYSKQEDLKVCDSLEVVARTKNICGGDWGIIAKFNDIDGKTHTVSISRGEIYTPGAKLSQRLGREGLHVDQISSRSGLAPINQYLNSVPMRELPQITTVSHGGWVDDTFRCFVFEGDEISVSDDAHAKLSATGRAVKKMVKGELKEWKRNFHDVAIHSKRMIFVTSVSLAAPLVPILEAENAFFHFYGESGCGKTSLERVAASVWGDNSYVQSWKTTKNAPEAMASRYNNLPLILDELNQSESDTLYGVSYLLGNGRGKARLTASGEEAEVKEWKLFGISTGEESFRETKHRQSKFGQRIDTLAGEQIRFLSIPASEGPYGAFESFPASVETEKERRDFVHKHCNEFDAYGIAGRVFLKRIEMEIQKYGLKVFREKLLKTINEFERRFTKLTRLQCRALRAFAIVAAAGELAISFQIFPLKKGMAEESAQKCFEAWLASNETPEARQDEFVDSLLNDSITKSASYAHYREDSATRTDPRTSESLGLAIEEKSGKLVATVYLPKQFDKSVRELGEGISETEAKKVLSTRELFLAHNDKSHPCQYRMPNEKVRMKLLPRWYYIILNSLGFKSREECIETLIRIFDGAK